MKNSLKLTLGAGVVALAGVVAVAIVMNGNHDHHEMDHSNHMPSANKEMAHGQVHDAPVDITGLSRTDHGDMALLGVAIRATLPNAPVGGGYLTMQNNGTVDDRLVSVSVTFARKSEIHDMVMNDNVMQMRPMPDGVVIPAGETVVFAPGGKHLMFMGLEEQLVAGAEAMVTLTFEKAGETSLAFPIVDMKAMNHGTGN